MAMRNYNIKVSATKVGKIEMLKCPITKCNKKYKSEGKRQLHVEKDHYYETRNSNYFKFDHKVRAQIYESAASYIVELDDIRKSYESGLCYGESSAKNLLPQLYGKKINPDDLKRIMTAQATFAKTLLKENLYLCDWSSVMDDLELFFNLGLPYYDTNFCPTLLIDFLWHAMMQLPDFYVEICRKSCVDIMPHCNILRIEDEDNKRHEYFLQVFQYKFKRVPYWSPSTNVSGAFPITEIRRIFINLRDKELEELKNDRIREEEIRIKKIKITKTERENRTATLKEISEHLKIPLEKINSSYDYVHYLYGYEQGYRGVELKSYVEERLREDRQWHAKC